jgi:hypothetical protein
MLVQKIIDAVARGEVPKNVVAGCLKDETRDLERVKAGKTRLFCVGSLSHLIWTVMVMGALVMEMKDKRATSVIAIGTDIHSFDWKLLYAKIFTGDGFLGAGDFGNYDTSINYWMGWIIGKLCVWKIGMPVGTIYYDSVMFACLSSLAPMLVVLDKVFWMDYFNSSGNWLTGFINSCADIIIFNFTTRLIIANNKEDCQGLEEKFRSELMTLIVYGDDNVWKILNDRFAKHFNMVSLKAYIFELFGMEYTTPTKGLIDKPFLEPEEISFLARKFKQEGGNLKAPLDEDSIYSMLNWYRKPSPESELTDDQQYSQNIEMAMQEFFHYGRQRFEIEEVKLRNHCLEIGLEYPALSFEHYQLRWLQHQK